MHENPRSWQLRSWPHLETWQRSRISGPTQTDQIHVPGCCTAHWRLRNCPAGIWGQVGEGHMIHNPRAFAASAACQVFMHLSHLILPAACKAGTTIPHLQMREWRPGEVKWGHRAARGPGPGPLPAPELLPVFQEAFTNTLSTCLGGGCSPEGSVGGRTAQEAGEAQDGGRHCPDFQGTAWRWGAWSYLPGKLTLHGRNNETSLLMRQKCDPQAEHFMQAECTARAQLP